MPITPPGSSTLHFLYVAAPVVDSTGNPQELVGPVSFRDAATQTSLAPRDRTSLSALASPTTDAFGLSPGVYLPSSGGLAEAQVAGGPWCPVPCAETVPYSVYTQLQTDLASALVTVAAAQTAAAASATSAAASATAAAAVVGAPGPAGAVGAQGANGQDGAGVLVLAVGEAIPAGTASRTTVVRFPADTVATVSAATDTFTTSAAHGLTVGKVLIPTTDGAAPITRGTPLFVISVPTTTTFTVSLTLGGSLLDVTADGSLRYVVGT